MEYTGEGERGGFLGVFDCYYIMVRGRGREDGSTYHTDVLVRLGGCSQLVWGMLKLQKIKYEVL